MARRIQLTRAKLKVRMPPRLSQSIAVMQVGSASGAVTPRRVLRGKATVRGLAG
jgi:hypothetical protein